MFDSKNYDQTKTKVTIEELENRSQKAISEEKIGFENA
jgi:hypothetical protein